MADAQSNPIVLRAKPVAVALGEVKLDPEVFGIEPNIGRAPPGGHRPARRRPGRDPQDQEAVEVRGGGAKPWRQKGTGRARQGSIRAPHWRGGGVAHGPEPRDYSQRTPKKMRRLALYSALSARAVGVGGPGDRQLRLDDPYDERCGGVCWARSESSGKTLLVSDSGDEIAGVAFRNLPQVWITEPGQLTAYDVLWAAHVIFTRRPLDAVDGGHAYDVSKSDFVKEGEGDMKDPRDIIIAPVVSEKSYDMIEKGNTYTFVVDRRSNKSEIKDAIEDDLLGQRPFGEHPEPDGQGQAHRTDPRSPGRCQASPGHPGPG